MLKTYKDIFNELNGKKINYIFYKSLNFIDEDLQGERGDLDILIDKNQIEPFEQVIYKYGFKKILKKGAPYYYFGLDVETGKWLFIDLDYRVRLGYKPFRPYSIYIDVNKLKAYKYLNLNLLDDSDYVALMLLMRSTAKNPKQFDYDEIKNIIITSKINTEGYIFNVLSEVTGISAEEILSQIGEHDNWSFFKENYRASIIKKSNKNIFLLIKNRINILYNIKKGILLKIGFPEYRIRKIGFLISFTGVDGSGKSSSVEYFENLLFFKKTGIKVIYFGNNNYVLPFVGKIMKIQFQNKIFLIMKGILGKIDRQFRVFIALYYILLGNIVVADRYYYDDLINIQKSDKKIISLLYKIYDCMFRPKMIVKPKLSFYMDVSPDVAYKRKQDYSFEKMLKMNKKYKNFMNNEKDIIFIDTNNEKNIVNKDILNAYYECK